MSCVWILWLQQVTEALSRAGLESSNLIVGIDFTKSNEWTGNHSPKSTAHHREHVTHLLIQVNSRSTAAACTPSVPPQTPTNKPSPSSDGPCRPSTRTTWSPVLDLEMVITFKPPALFFSLKVDSWGDWWWLCYSAATTHDRDVFSFYPGERPCNGFEEALERYREITPHLRLAGIPHNLSFGESEC